MISASIRKLRDLRNADFNSRILFDNENLSQVDNCIYLGISLDSDLKWESQVKRICQNVSYKLSLLNRLRKFLSSDLLRKIYISHIQPCLEYGISVWGYSSEHNKYLIQRLQHRAARIVLSNFDYINVRGHDLVKQLGWQSIDTRRNFYTASLMHKCVYKTAPIHLTNETVLTADSHGVHTRASINGMIQVPQPNCEIFKTSFKYQSACLWNSLPSELREIRDLHNFKRMYKLLYFN